jgi:hypothetical protein
VNETDRSRREREGILRGSAAEVFIEHFHNRAQRISMLWFPFPDDANEILMGAFILLHAGNLPPLPAIDGFCGTTTLVTWALSPASGRILEFLPD